MIVGAWLFFAALVGILAASWGRSGFGWFLLGCLLSPLLAIIILLIAGKYAPKEMRIPCPVCKEGVMPDALKCKHCGAELTPRQPKDVPTEMESLVDFVMQNPLPLAGIAVAVFATVRHIFF